MGTSPRVTRFRVSEGRRDFLLGEAEFVESPWSCVIVDDNPGTFPPFMNQLITKGLCDVVITLPFCNEAIDLLTGKSIDIHVASEDVNDKREMKLIDNRKCVLILDMYKNSDDPYYFNGFDTANYASAGAQFWDIVENLFPGRTIVMSAYGQDSYRIDNPQLLWLPFVDKKATEELSERTIEALIQGISYLVNNHRTLEELEVDEWRKLVKAGESFDQANHLPPKGKGILNDNKTWTNWVETTINHTSLFRVLRDSGYQIPKYDIPLSFESLWGYKGVYPRLRDLAATYPNSDTNDNPLREYLGHCRDVLEGRYGSGQYNLSVSVDLDLSVPDNLKQRLESNEFDYLGFNAVAFAKLVDCMASSLKERIENNHEGLFDFRVTINGSAVLISIEEPCFSITEEAFQLLPESSHGKHRGGHMAGILRYASILGAKELFVVNKNKAKRIRLNPEGKHLMDEVVEHNPAAPGFILQLGCPFILRS